MTIETLDKIAELLAKATPGLWLQSHRKGDDEMYRTEVYDLTGETIATFAWHAVAVKYADGAIGNRTDRAENSELTATLVNAASELLDLAREALESRKVIEVAPHAKTCNLEIYASPCRSACGGCTVNSCNFHPERKHACNCWKSKRPTRGAGEREKV